MTHVTCTLTAKNLGLGYKLCAVIPIAGQRTYATTFRALKVTSQVATPGAESAVCDCLVVVVVRKISMSDASPMRLAF